MRVCRPVSRRTTRRFVLSTVGYLRALPAEIPRLTEQVLIVKPESALSVLDAPGNVSIGDEELDRTRFRREIRNSL